MILKQILSVFYIRSFLLFLIPYSIFLMSGCSSSETTGTGQTRADRPDQESWDVIITLTNEGSKLAVVKAGHLEKYNERLYVLLDQQVEVDFYDVNEQHTSRLTSQQAEVDEKSDFMRALQQVVVKSDSGVTLFTDTLSWDHEMEMIYTDDSVMITTEQNDTLYGVGFESDVQMEHWKILHPTGVTDRGRE